MALGFRGLGLGIQFRGLGIIGFRFLGHMNAIRLPHGLRPTPFPKAPCALDGRYTKGNYRWEFRVYGASIRLLEGI